MLCTLNLQMMDVIYFSLFCSFFVEVGSYVGYVQGLFMALCSEVVPDGTQGTTYIHSAEDQKGVEHMQGNCPN